MDKSKACEQHRIEEFLANGLGPGECTALESHLEHCESCRRLLESRAADPEVWTEVRDVFGCLPLDPPEAPEPDAASVELDAVLGLLAPTDDPCMLGRLGPYEIVGAIGSGGMGVVLKGFDRSLNRFVAIKALAPHLATSGAARRRFSREAKAAAAVVHENVIAIHGVSEDGPLPYLVMPYIRGVSLEKRIRQQGTLQPVEVLRVALQTAEALDAAHTQGLVHRDIKPANILLEDGVERVTITDFGLARAADDATLTRTGVIAGTPQYMSPEQARGEAVDGRSDLFSLGSVMYAMCTGSSPFRAETSYGALRLICETPAPRVADASPQVPEWMDRMIDRLLRRDPGERFQSAAEVARLLRQCLAHLHRPSVVPLPESLAPRRGASVRAMMCVAAGLAALVALAGGSALWRSRAASLDASPAAAGSPLAVPADDARRSSRPGAPLPPNRPPVAPEPWSGDLVSPLPELKQSVDQFEQSLGRFWAPAMGETPRPATSPQAQE